MTRSIKSPKKLKNSLDKINFVLYNKDAKFVSCPLIYYITKFVSCQHIFTKFFSHTVVVVLKFNEKLKNLREDKGFTQQELAANAGISSRMVQIYESGKSSPRASVASKLADALGVTLSTLFGEEEMLVAEAAEIGGARAKRDIQQIISEVSGLFAGGEIDESEKDEVIQALNFAYWDAKKKNQKYASRKNDER